MVLVDTSIWSLVLRRKTQKNNPIRLEMEELIFNLRVQMIGPVRQEILSGIREKNQFERFRERLQDFADLPISTTDYERAAEFFNICRRQGIQGSNTDFLICAIAVNQDIPIFTTDKDFTHYQNHLPINLHTFNR
jgi:predicted nucleic acid-binding protein